MRIRSLGFNFSGDRPLRNFLLDCGFTVKMFYPYSSLTVGTYPETIDGANSFLREDESTEAVIGFPVNFNFEKEWEIDNETKFIYVERDIDAWVDLFKSAQNLTYHSVPYQFEELLCKTYLNTDKVLSQDLTEEELRSIYLAHDQKVTEFFAGKPNYIKVSLDDPQISAKLRTFLGITAEIEFQASSETPQL